MTRTLVVLNPSAGAVEDVNALIARICRLPQTDVRVAAREREVNQVIETALAKGCTTVVAAGGDGTLNAVVNSVAGNKGAVSVGLIPLGTGNDFARILGLPVDVDEALDVLIDGHIRAVDLAQVVTGTPRYFVNISAGGFSGLVDGKLTPEMKRTWGPLAYLRSAAAALPEMQVYETTLLFDDAESLTVSLYNVVIANGGYFGGGVNIAPEAAVDDGLLDIILIRESSAAELALLAGNVALGNHLSSDSVVFRRAAKVAVNSHPEMSFNVDGELIGENPAIFTVFPRALPFIVARHE